MMEVCRSCRNQNPGFDLQNDEFGDLTYFCKVCGAENSKEVIDDLAAMIRDANECDLEPPPGAA